MYDDAPYWLLVPASFILGSACFIMVVLPELVPLFG